MTNVKNAKRYNDNMFRIFEQAKLNNERNDFIKFYESNTHLTLNSAVKAFRALESMPVV
jgi:hypothetical protein